jgi:hypothetical protein
MNSTVNVELLSELLSRSFLLNQEDTFVRSDDNFVKETARKLLENWKYRDQEEPQQGQLESWLRTIMTGPGGEQIRLLEVMHKLVADFFIIDPTTWAYAPNVNPVNVRRKLPVRLLLALRTARWRRNLARDECYDCLLSTDPQYVAIRTEGFADGHVHIGAAIPYLGLVFEAMDSIQAFEVDVNKIPWHSTAEGTYRLDGLLMAAKIMLHALLEYSSLPQVRRPGGFLSFVASWEPLAEEVRTAITSGTYWKTVTNASSSPQVASYRDFSDQAAWLLEASKAFPRYTSDEPDPLHIILGRNFPSLADIDDRAFQIFYRLFSFCIDHPADDKFTFNLIQLVRCLCILYRAITPAMEGGLDVFVRAFDTHKMLRRTGGLESRRHDLVTHGLNYLNRHNSLKRLELRTSLDLKKGERVSETQVASDLVSYLEKYSDYLNSTRDAQIQVVLPITLVRRPTSLESPLVAADDQVPSAWQFSELWNTVVAMSELFRYHPEASRFFGIIDVAGNENRLANWIFYHLLTELNARLEPELTGTLLKYPLVYTYHAGEYFASPLQGLRRVGEVIEFMPQVTRIGHGLALGCDEWYEGLVNSPVEENAQELLDDLAWSRRYTTGTLRQALDDQIKLLARELYGNWASQDAEVVENAYRSRFQEGILHELGMLSYSNFHPQQKGYESIYHGLVRDVYLARETDLPARRLLAQYITNKNNNYDLQHFTKSLIDFRPLLQEIYNEVLPKILHTIAARGVMIETCPTSNLIIAKISSYSKHPIFRFTSEKLPVTINTDDPGIFHITIEDEYASIWQASAEKFSTMIDRVEWIERIRSTGIREFAKNLNALTPEGLQEALSNCINDLRTSTRGADDRWQGIS